MKIDDLLTVLTNNDCSAASLVRGHQKEAPLPQRTPWHPQRDFELPGTSPGHDYPEPGELPGTSPGHDYPEPSKDDPPERKKK